jgi:hypothetical protein
MALTFFVAPLRCSYCAASLPADTSTNMQNHLSEEPWTVYGIGDPIPDSAEDLDCAFITVHPRSGVETRILQSWVCPCCGSAQWAEVILAQGRVLEILPVTLSADVIDRVHYAVDGIAETYYGITGEGLDVDGTPRPDFGKRLAAALRAQATAKGGSGD